MLGGRCSDFDGTPPTVGWADVATKRDLEALESRFEAKLERALREQTRTLLYANLGYVTAFGSLVLAAKLEGAERRATEGSEVGGAHGEGLAQVGEDLVEELGPVGAVGDEHHGEVEAREGS